MRVKLWENGVMLFDTNDVADNSPKALQGGRLGVYFLGATKATFSKLSYRYNNNIGYFIKLRLMYIPILYRCGHKM